jgi:hypothetical protein
LTTFRSPVHTRNFHVERSDATEKVDMDDARDWFDCELA